MDSTPLPPPPPPRRVVRPTVVAPPPVPLARRVSARRSDRPSRQPRIPTTRRRGTPVLPLLLTIGVFAGMMAVSFGQIARGILAADETLSLTDTQLRDKLVNETMVLEGLDAVIVLAGILVAGRPGAWRAAGPRLLAWAMAAPGFVLLLGFNLGYHFTLQALAQAVAPPDQAPQPPPVDIGLGPGMWVWAILLVCVQPAVVEELFFRYLLLGHLRPHLGVHGAVWVSAVIFGMAHLGNIPGWPVLICLGAGLGYARVYSGNLALPILLHFLHNFAVLLIEALTR